MDLLLGVLVRVILLIAVLCAAPASAQSLAIPLELGGPMRDAASPTAGEIGLFDEGSKVSAEYPNKAALRASEPVAKYAPSTSLQDEKEVMPSVYESMHLHGALEGNCQATLPGASVNERRSPDGDGPSRPRRERQDETLRRATDQYDPTEKPVAEVNIADGSEPSGAHAFFRRALQVNAAGELGLTHNISFDWPSFGAAVAGQTFDAVTTYRFLHNGSGCQESNQGIAANGVRTREIVYTKVAAIGSTLLLQKVFQWAANTEPGKHPQNRTRGKWIMRIVGYGFGALGAKSAVVNLHRCGW